MHRSAQFDLQRVTERPKPVANVHGVTIDASGPQESRVPELDNPYPAPVPNLSRLAALIGWFGVAVFLGTAVVTAIGYTGSAGEPYSPLNHYVSELGERKNSELSVVFNSGIAIGGICLAVVLVEVGRRIAGARGLAIGLLGILAGVSGTFVGFIPMDEKQSHLLVSGSFFLALAAAVGLATLWMGGPAFPRRAAARWLGLLTVTASIAFFVLIRVEGPGPGGVADPNGPRPAIAADTIIEWLALLGVLGWVAVASATIWRAERPVVGVALRPVSGESR